ncbi:MAG TPA: hypothetical protein VFJ57_10790 [Solirubrobacterales bacterium]|nr:hypothetical protein [Solirubrobacterales bacterium]
MSSIHNTLVVAGRSADYPGLADALRLHRAGVPTSFTLLVPAVPNGFAWATDMHSGWPAAIERAERATARLKDAGLDLEETIVGDPDPMAAVGDVLHARRFDEIVVATLPRGVSTWLRIGLPARLGRVTDLPVTRICVDRPARARAYANELAAFAADPYASVR